MNAAHRWGLAGVATALVVLTPYADRLVPVHDPDIATATLVTAVRDSAATPYSGTVEVNGRVGLPVADHFSDLADLFGGSTRLRVWWRSDVEWRVDRLLDTGEVDLFHLGHITTEWSYERRAARVSGDPEIRLPRDADLLPPEVARRALDGEATSDVVRLPARRVAGVDAAGLRVPVTDERSTIRRVDLWVDPDTGVTLSAQVYGDSSQPALGSTFTTYSASRPATTVTRFHPARGVNVFSDSALDIADAADQFSLVEAPSTVAGLEKDSGVGAALYGTGLTRLLAVPLLSREAHELAYELRRSGGRMVQGGRLLRVGPLGVLVWPGAGPLSVRWMVAGTVTDATLLEAARDLTAEVTLR